MQRSAENRRLKLWQMSALSFPGGVAYALVVTTIGTWMADRGMSPVEIGLVAAAQWPWTIKWLIAPLLDRFSLPFGGRRRGWIILTGIPVIASILLLTRAEASNVQLLIGIATLIAAACAISDIVTDAYAVELMKKDEQGPGNALRTMIWRLGFLGASAGAITAADYVAWQTVFLVIALLCLPNVFFAATAPEPDIQAPPPKSLFEAVWGPLKSFFSGWHAIGLALFIFSYKFGDNMAIGQLSPFFLQEIGVSKTEMGVAQKTIGVISTITGTLIGGALLPRIGLGRGLWLFGFAQAGTCLLYAACSMSGGDRFWMYSAITMENAAAGMGTAALLSLMMRAVDKRYSAAQFALLTSLMGLGRTAATALSGYVVVWLGYTPYFIVSALFAIPGLLLLLWLAPLNQREVPVLGSSNS